GREDEAVVDVAQARPGDRHVDGEGEDVEAGRLRAADQLGAGAGGGPHVEREPLGRRGGGGRQPPGGGGTHGEWEQLGRRGGGRRQTFGRARAHRRPAGGDADALGDARHGALAL